MSASNIGPITHVENLNHFSMEQAVKLFEELLKIERENIVREKRIVSEKVIFLERM